MKLPLGDTHAVVQIYASFPHYPCWPYILLELEYSTTTCPAMYSKCVLFTAEKAHSNGLEKRKLVSAAARLLLKYFASLTIIITKGPSRKDVPPKS